MNIAIIINMVTLIPGPHANGEGCNGFRILW